MQCIGALQRYCWKIPIRRSFPVESVPGQKDRRTNLRLREIQFYPDLRTGSWQGHHWLAENKRLPPAAQSGAEMGKEAGLPVHSTNCRKAAAPLTGVRRRRQGTPGYQATDSPARWSSPDIHSLPKSLGIAMLATHTSRSESV